MDIREESLKRHYAWKGKIEVISRVRIDTRDLSGSREIVTAKMKTSCFYPCAAFFPDGTAGFSYTVARKHIRLSRFDPDRYLI